MHCILKAAGRRASRSVRFGHCARAEIAIFISGLFDLMTLNTRHLLHSAQVTHVQDVRRQEVGRSLRS